MSCNHPIEGFRAAVPNEKGRRPIFFNMRKSGSDEVVKLPCGRCIGCRLERARQWSIRCMHEASLHDDNCFLTLTYDDEHLPEGRSLVRRDLQLFLKRMRKHSVSRRGRSFRFYGCGEYGEKNFRPHYHLLCFDFDFRDKKPWRKSPSGHQMYRSETLEELWKLGSSEIGSVSFQSAGYVARYCLKKVVGAKAGEHYLRYDADGRVFSIVPEFAAQSMGVGRPWLERFKTDVYPHDYVVVNGQKVKPPLYYDRWLEKVSPDEFDLLREKREPQNVEELVARLDDAPVISRVDGRFVRRGAVREEVAASKLATFTGRSL